MCAVLEAGCAPFRVLDLPAAPAHSDPNRQSRMGLTLSARLLDDAISRESYFGPGFRDSGILPVLLAIENRGQSSFDLRRADLHLVLENGEQFEPIAPGEVLESSRRSFTVAFLLVPLIVPPILLANQISEHNFELSRALALKSLPSRLRIEAGDPPAARAVFYRDPTGSLRSPRAYDSATLQVTVEREGERPEEDSVEVAAAEPTPSSDPRSTVGRVLTYTLALAREAFQ